MLTLGTLRRYAALTALSLLPLGAACTGETDSSEDNVTDVKNSSVKNQSIGNCWVYASMGWAESLHLTQSGEELNLSESYISYWHWYEQIAGGPAGQVQLAKLDKDQISTGGWYGLAAELMRRYGVMDEGRFIPEEAESARSSRQSSALSAINASLKTGALKDPAARRDRKLVRAELDKAWGLSASTITTLDQTFGADVSKSFIDTGLAPATDSGIRLPKSITVGHNISLADAIGLPSSSFNFLQRKGKYAWNEVSYPTGATAKRDYLARMQKAMHAGMPVIMVWFVDFAGMDSQNRFMAPPATPGRQGGHMTVVEDYQINDVPGFGTLAAGTLVTDPKALDAALSPQAKIEFVRIKNSWGSSLAPPNATDDQRGYYDIYMPYLDGPLTRCTESNGDKCGIKSKVPGLTGLVLPPDAFVTDAKVLEGGCADMCVPGPARATTCDACTDLICSQDTWCCESGWDERCVQEAKDICEIPCP